MSMLSLGMTYFDQLSPNEQTKYLSKLSKYTFKVEPILILKTIYILPVELPYVNFSTHTLEFTDDILVIRPMVENFASVHYNRSLKC